ncbi:MAG: hypothetical protein HOP18_23355 [Deltaproteobacteria bacterium]|nr:hypothetical protein [Deltaproteobacteria bacterium]
MMLAEACEQAGKPDERLTALSEAFEVMERTGGRLYAAELYRLKGTLTPQKFQVLSSELNKVQGPKSSTTSPQILNPKSQEEAEACFLKAIEIARKSQTKSLELRATMSLVRLWRRRGKQAEARQRLADMYGWFTEGFDTQDLREAKVLLDELSP